MASAPHVFRVGDQCVIKGWPPVTLEIIDTSDPAMLTLRGPTGQTMRVGRLACVPIPTTERSES
jgi:hypothetical protein